MEFFYSTEKLNFKIIDKNNLSIDVEIDAFDNKAINYLDPAKIYFTTSSILNIVKNSARQFNDDNSIKIIDKSSYIQSKYLDEKYVFTKKENLQSNNIKIALIFDINTKFETNFNKSVIIGLNHLYKNLSNKYQDVQFDLFTIYLSGWINLAKDTAINNLYLIPETLENLISYDAYIKFSDLVNEQNIIEKAKINQCLKVLGIENINSDVTLIKNNDLVSIVIPTYNRQEFLKESIESVLDQTYKNIELIIVDDGSIDNTKAVVENYLSDSRIKYIYQTNMGISFARNNGIKFSKGEYLMFLDDDDIYFPYAVEKLLNFLKKQPDNVKLIYGDIIYFHGNNKTFIREKNVLSKPELFVNYIVGSNFTTPGQMIIKSQAIKDVGMYDVNFKNSADYELWTKIIYKYDIAKIDIPITLYRKHDAQQTSKKGNIRYYCDMVALKFWYKLLANKVNLFTQDSTLIDEKLDFLAMRVFNSYFINYDTALEILIYTHKMYFNQDREDFINQLKKNIPIFIKEKYDNGLRITDDQKEELKRQAML